MSGVLIISGTDTDVGKTVVAAGLAAALDAHYWKPVQAGTEDGTDSERAVALGVPQTHILPEAHRLALPASPHLAAEREGCRIDPDRLALPTPRPLIIEGAGGLMVPLRRDPPALIIDLFARWNSPVLLVARSGLGTINHSLLSIEALRARGIAIAGLLFVGAPHADNEATLPRLGAVRSFGRLPQIEPLDAPQLAEAMRAHVDLAGVRAAMGLAA
ncbi:dethiobiotin synthetase [Sphingobium sp. SYK-6]|uniref:dethiobiotin synthase n=1 Tax=Sphingobium sp. (strain NBRC 103272 / SYK-6) TaxID=627192 RepID=UPI0002277B1D|nr:dethiobiotin synthase [Sphingobium sp. SYK-6]BAK68190.1 dethiobiotin synthetase [Sphingobium sp. SYK-6]